LHTDQSTKNAPKGDSKSNLLFHSICPFLGGASYFPGSTYPTKLLNSCGYSSFFPVLWLNLNRPVVTEDRNEKRFWLSASADAPVWQKALGHLPEVLVVLVLGGHLAKAHPKSACWFVCSCLINTSRFHTTFLILLPQFFPHLLGPS
jgi:hypothetical protein